MSAGLLLVCCQYPAPAFDSSHKLFTRELMSYVEHGSVHYARWQKNRRGLERYICSLADLDQEAYAKLPRADKEALWLNSYNAFNIKIVLDHYPIRGTLSYYPANSVRQIPDVWQAFHFKSGGRDVTLDDIEHGILRLEFHDPRLHFAVVCARGNAPLRAVAYTGENLESLLEQQKRIFLGDDRNVHYDQVHNELHISELFKWFLLDFTVTDFFKGRRVPPSDVEIILAYLQRNTLGDLQKRLSEITDLTGLRLVYEPFDWSLNDADAASSPLPGPVR